MTWNTNCSKSEDNNTLILTNFPESEASPLMSYEDSFSNIPVIPPVLQVSDVYVESKLVYTSGTSLGTSQTLAASHNVT